MNTKTFVMTGALALGLFAIPSTIGAADMTPNRDGFVLDWLLLSPIQLPSDTDGAVAIDKSQVPDEANLKPKAGDKVKVGSKELTWKKVKGSDYYLDLNALANEQTEMTMAYAVCYLQSETERKDLHLKMGSNDQGKVYLNGKAVVKATEPRTMDQDSDIARKVTLNKGVNVVVFKIFNEGGSEWSGCLRFTEMNGKAVKDLVIRLEP